MAGRWACEWVEEEKHGIQIQIAAHDQWVQWALFSLEQHRRHRTKNNPKTCKVVFQGTIFHFHVMCSSECQKHSQPSTSSAGTATAPPSLGANIPGVTAVGLVEGPHKSA